MHFQYLVEDQSGAALIRILMQKIVELYPNATYDCKGFRGIGGFTRKNTIKETKTGKLLNDLATYLRGFDRSLQSFPSVIIVVLDSDDHDVQQFRSELEAVAMQNMIKIDHVFCLAVEEIEAWLLGDRHALLSAYPHAKMHVLNTYVQDSICGTWEVLADAVYPGGTSKLSREHASFIEIGKLKAEWAQNIGIHMDLKSNESPSFNDFTKDAVANFLYSFNECLDHWRTYIVRAYGEGSNYFSAYQKLTTLAFDTYDEYKITYALRNFQHVDDVFDGISVRLGMPAQIYAHRQRLLDNSRFTAPQRAAFTKLEECFDLFPIFKTAKEQLEQIEKKLMFYTVTPEQENKAIDALKFKEELCGPHGVLLLGKLLDPNGNELEATDSTIIKLAQEQSEASLSYQDEIPWGVCRLLQLFQGTNYQDI